MLLTSREAWREQEAVSDPTIRERLKQERGRIAVVADDHRVRAVSHQQDHLGGFIANVEVSDVVDQKLFDGLIAAGLKIKPTKRRRREY